MLIPRRGLVPDSRYWILGFCVRYWSHRRVGNVCFDQFILVLSVELGFWIPIVNRILDSLSCIPDSEARAFGNPLHGPIYALLIKR